MPAMAAPNYYDAARLTAIEEAGHAVIARALGIRVQFATVAYDGKPGGRVRYSTHGTDPERRTIMRMAGYFAQQLLCPGCLPNFAKHSQDFKAILAVDHRLLPRCEQRARELVTKHRQQIADLADIFAAHPTLTGDQIDHVLKGTTMAADYKFVDPAALDVIRSNPKGFEAWTQRGGQLPMIAADGAADTFDEQLKRALKLAEDQLAKDQVQGWPPTDVNKDDFGPGGFRSSGSHPNKDQLPGQCPPDRDGYQHDQSMPHPMAQNEPPIGPTQHEQHRQDLSDGGGVNDLHNDRFGRARDGMTDNRVDVQPNYPTRDDYSELESGVSGEPSRIAAIRAILMSCGIPEPQIDYLLNQILRDRMDAALDTGGPDRFKGMPERGGGMAGDAALDDFNKAHPRAIPARMAGRGQFDRMYEYENAKAKAREQRQRQLAMDAAAAYPAVLQALRDNPPRGLNLLTIDQVKNVARVVAEHQARELRGEAPIELTAMDMRLYAGDAVAHAGQINNAMHAPYNGEALRRSQQLQDSEAAAEAFLEKQRRDHERKR